MTRYEGLLIKAEKEGVEVLEIDLGTNKKCGKCINNIIIINKNLSNKEKHELLAEELGHYYKTFGDITDQSKIENRKEELKARRKGRKLILEPLDLVYAFRCGCNNIYEMADFFEITEKELNEIVKDFRKQYGLGKKFDKYFITFEPNLGFCKIF
ncbi:ImmA/IrrE family metallo-endopeptidase [Clostridium chromiireducens]|uniref:ImmA/IrrE family metallo-endopeptidase n=1 Tax=Clostridium chromiireducens TaxID=225345 RepID=A0A964W2A2_9CLOT|nr:ImmA/IrrE family metallo-endopeptidase [Clostridium chromiireducens]MVX63862.1 ImmA/IrrE family metallo-endopeptidase [Clostridium chromiireducens]